MNVLSGPEKIVIDTLSIKRYMFKNEIGRMRT